MYCIWRACRNQIHCFSELIHENRLLLRAYSECRGILRRPIETSSTVPQQQSKPLLAGSGFMVHSANEGPVGRRVFRETRRHRQHHGCITYHSSIVQVYPSESPFRADSTFVLIHHPRTQLGWRRPTFVDGESRWSTTPLRGPVPGPSLSIDKEHLQTSLHSRSCHKIHRHPLTITAVRVGGSTG